MRRVCPRCQRQLGRPQPVVLGPGGELESRLPGAADDVLLGALASEFRSGNVTVLSFAGTGQLRVSGGVLQNAQASSIGSLLLSGGTLGGTGTWLSQALRPGAAARFSEREPPPFASSLSISGAAGKQITGAGR
jgi:hypothetical protein